MRHEPSSAAFPTSSGELSPLRWSTLRFWGALGEAGKNVCESGQIIERFSRRTFVATGWRCVLGNCQHDVAAVRPARSCGQVAPLCASPKALTTIRVGWLITPSGALTVRGLSWGLSDTIRAGVFQSSRLPDEKRVSHSWRSRSDENRWSGQEPPPAGCRKIHRGPPEPVGG